jgi:hypothetical protein
MKIHTLTITLLILWSSLVFAQDKPKFSTKQTRELWQVCSTSFRNLNPGMGPHIYTPVCDCYVDHIRANYTPDQVMTSDDNSMGMTQEGYSKLSQELRDTCNPKIEKPKEFT